MVSPERGRLYYSLSLSAGTNDPMIMTGFLFLAGSCGNLGGNRQIFFVPTKTTKIFQRDEIAENAKNDEIDENDHFVVFVVFSSLSSFSSFLSKLLCLVWVYLVPFLLSSLFLAFSSFSSLSSFVLFRHFCQFCRFCRDKKVSCNRFHAIVLTRFFLISPLFPQLPELYELLTGCSLFLHFERFKFPAPGFFIVRSSSLHDEVSISVQ